MVGFEIVYQHRNLSTAESFLSIIVHPTSGACRGPCDCFINLHNELFGTVSRSLSNTIVNGVSDGQEFKGIAP